MAHQFEQLARQMAGSTPRRRVLKFMGASVAGAVATAVIRPFGSSGRAMGVVAGACDEAGQQACGPGCCPKGYACASTDSGCGCCCRPGTTPCGTTCCRSGIACLDRARSICGCQAGPTPCGDASNPTCCPAGTACAPGCPPPSNNTRPALCFCAPSDVNIKDNIVPVSWERA